MPAYDKTLYPVQLHHQGLRVYVVYPQTNLLANAVWRIFQKTFSVIPSSDCVSQLLRTQTGFYWLQFYYFYIGHIIQQQTLINTGLSGNQKLATRCGELQSTLQLGG